MISPEDVELLFVTDEPAEAVRTVIDRRAEQTGETPAAPVKADAE